MRILFCIFGCLLSVVVNAESLVVVPHASIENGNWYPLTKAEMTRAVVDTALVELTEGGHFLIAKDADSDKAVDGDLNLDIFLIGPAELVKLTLTLHLPDDATYVSTASMDIHNLDYQGIYKAFEYIGTEAAKRLNSKLTVLKFNANKKESFLAQNSDLSDIFNQAQRLKRREEYHEARALFERVIELDQMKDSRWAEMADDEVRYGLPLFEAENLLLNNTLKAPTVLASKMEQVEHLYRQILADNTDKPERVVEMNRRLDGISVSRKALKNSMKASAMSKVWPLKIMMVEHYMMYGEWPDKGTVEADLKRLAADIELVEYQIEKENLSMIVRDSVYDAEIKLRGNDRGIQIEMN